MSLPAAWTDKIFTKLTLAYGRDFLARWEGIDLNDVKSDWSHELAGFAEHPEAIAYALANLPPKAPSVIEFRALARRAPLPEVKLLDAPKADPARVAGSLDAAGGTPLPQRHTHAHHSGNRARGRTCQHGHIWLGRG